MRWKDVHIVTGVQYRRRQSREEFEVNASLNIDPWALDFRNFYFKINECLNYRSSTVTIFQLQDGRNRQLFQLTVDVTFSEIVEFVKLRLRALGSFHGRPVVSGVVIM